MSLQVSIKNDFDSLDHLKSSVSATAMGMISSGWVWVVTDMTGRLAVVPTFGSGTLLVRARQQSFIGESLVLGEERRTVLTRVSQPSSTAGAAPSGSPLPPHNEGGLSTSSPSSGVHTPVGGFTPPTQTRSLHTSLSQSSSYSPYTTSYKSGGGFDSDYDARSSFSLLGKTGSQMGQRISPLFCVSVHEHAWMSAGLGVWGKEEYLKRFWNVLDWKKVSDSYMKLTKFKNREDQL